MYHDDFLRVAAQALGIKTPEGATVTEQENAILTAIAKLKRKQVQNRPPSAPADRVALYTRDVTLELLRRSSVRATAEEYGISEAQCRGVFADQVRSACFQAISSLLLAGATDQNARVKTLRWISSSPSKVLGRAREEPGLIGQTLNDYWEYLEAQDANDD